MKARFMIEIFEAEMERDPSGGMWDRYPFEVEGRELWISRYDLTDDQLTEVASAARELGERKQREAEALRLYGRAKQAGISGVIDGSKASD